MEQRDFLGDEVHMMQNDIKTLRAENELLKLKCERQDETLTSQRTEIVRLRAAYEDKVAESASLQSILENAGQVIHSGIKRYIERRDLKRDTRQAVNEETSARYKMEVGYDKKPESSHVDQTPKFQSPVGDHPLLPKVDVRTDEDVMRELAKGIDGGR